MLGALDVDDGQPLAPGRDVGIRARHVHVVRVGQRHDRALDDPGLGEIRDVEDLEPDSIQDEGVTELVGDRHRMIDPRSADLVGDLRVHRIAEIDHDQAVVGGDVGVGADEGDVLGAGELPVRIEREGALEEVVFRVAVRERARVDENQAFLAVGDEDVLVHRMDRLLLVLG